MRLCAYQGLGAGIGVLAAFEKHVTQKYKGRTINKEFAMLVSE